MPDSRLFRSLMAPGTLSFKGPKHGPFVKPQEICGAENDAGDRDGAIHHVALNAPSRIRNSPTNPLVPGKPMEAKPMISKNVASSGIFFAKPPHVGRQCGPTFE